MGTWSAPTTLAKAERLAELTERPILAANADDLLYAIAGSDTLFDMIAAARQEGRTLDIRPLLAFELDEMMNWMDRGDFVNGWEEGAERAVEQALVNCVAAGDADGTLAKIAAYDSDDQARGAVAAVLGCDAEEARSLEVEHGTVPGLRRVKTPDGRTFRFEPVWGVVLEARAQEPLPAP